MIRFSVFMMGSLGLRASMISPDTSSLESLARLFESDEQVILLIDEIDKADLEFPNDFALGARPNGVLYP